MLRIAKSEWITLALELLNDLPRRAQPYWVPVLASAFFRAGVS
jgi:hypothetical protein